MSPPSDRSEDDDRRQRGDDDDRPRRRRDENEEDAFDDDRPRRRSSRGKKKSGMSGTTIALIIGGVAFVSIFGCAVCMGLMLPAVQKVREAASRTTDMNNMRRIGISMHAYSDANKVWHAPFVQNPKTQKPNNGLSFRVGLLPYIEQRSVYDKFDLSESWDSTRNKPFSDTIIQDYSSPGQPSTMTPYRTFVGHGALFEEEGSPVRIQEITDGLANTILAVHATDSVPWAKPDEFFYDPNKPLPKLGDPNADGFNVLFADGHVSYMRKTVDEKILRAMITKNGGEPIPVGEW